MTAGSLCLAYSKLFVLNKNHIGRLAALFTLARWDGVFKPSKDPWDMETRVIVTVDSGADIKYSLGILTIYFYLMHFS
jgi:hypothetical protein